jgi:hypothetical protein
MIYTLVQVVLKVVTEMRADSATEMKARVVVEWVVVEQVVVALVKRLADVARAMLADEGVARAETTAALAMEAPEEQILSPQRPRGGFQCSHSVGPPRR